jgi:hypothetical protein
MARLDAIEGGPKTGQEHFRSDGEPLGFQLLDFWRWSASDLVGNTARGILAEYLVAQALGSAQPTRDEWLPFDVLSAGGLRVQVKSAAYLQSWYQSKPSRIAFSIRATRSWDPKTNVLAAQPTRECDVYVFALLAHREKATLDPMDVTQWLFYVLSRAEVDGYTRSQHSITLPSLDRCGARCVSWADLRSEVERVAGQGRG